MNAKILLLVLMPFACIAQEIEVNCTLEAKEIDSLVKVADYDKAYQMLEATKCISESHYLSAEKVLRQKLAAPATDVEKETYVKSILRLYTLDDKNFPANNRSNLVKRAKVLQQYQPDSTDAVFDLFDKAFSMDRDNFNDARGLYDYFELYFEKYKAGIKDFTLDNLIDKQDDVIGRLKLLSEKDPGEIRNYKTAIDAIHALTNAILTCDKLEAHYEVALPSRKKDAKWLGQATDNLISKNCLTTATASKMAAEWYGLQPDARSAYAMGVVSLRSRENQADAYKYFDESAEKEKDAVRKAEIFTIMASMFGSSDIPRAISLVKKAMQLRPDYGKPYLLLAQLYLSTGCGATPFEKKALFQLAAETVNKSVIADPTMKNMANVTASRYLKKAPTADEIKQAGQNGKTFTFGCGIGESVTFPN